MYIRGFDQKAIHVRSDFWLLPTFTLHYFPFAAALIAAASSTVSYT